ncbi:MAG: HlyU family transcriptional regulator [Natronospirillum sp.]
MLKWLKQLLGNSGETATTTTGAVQHEEEYHGYCLRIAPQKQGGQYRIAATIHKLDNPEKVHKLIRADLLPTLDVATEHSLSKARQAVDQLGDRLFK